MPEINSITSMNESDLTTVLTDDQKEYFSVIASLTSSLIKKRDEAVAFRASSGVESRWREDERLFEGNIDVSSERSSMLDYAAQTAPISLKNSPNRSTVEINVVRNKCETAEGRFSDIMLPTNRTNWDLKVTPVPKLIKSLNDPRIAMDKNTNQPIIGSNNQPVTISEIAQNNLKDVKDRMTLMKKEIADQLTECYYNAEQRKVIKKSARLGTGILKGPNVIKKVSKSYQKQTSGNESIYILSAIEEERPTSEEVSCWNLFPDPDTDENVKKSMGHIFERSNIRPKELLDLIGLNGYIPEQIIKVLKQLPIKTSVGYEPKEQKHFITQKLGHKGDLYERWDYYGELNRDDLQALNIDVSTYPEAFTLSACVVMVNDEPIKVMLNTLDSGDLPYDFFQWSQVSGSPWGIGLPRMMLWLQRIINGAMRAMMDNAGDSSGVNIVIGSDIAPVDGKMELTGKKLWKYVGEDPMEIDVNKLFAQFQVQNNQAELQNIIELAFKLLDLETGVPMVFQGEQQKLPETLGATNIMVDSNNVTLRSRVKLFDDQITVPHITKYYHWNMQYNDKEEIKGDFQANALGVSALLEKEQNFQKLIQLIPFKADPDFATRINWDEVIKKGLDILGPDIIRSDDETERKKQEFAQNQKPQIDPRVEAAQIKSQADMAEIKARNDLEMQILQFKSSESVKDRQHEMNLKLIERDIKMMEFAEKSGMNLDSIKAKLSSDAMKLETQIKLSRTNSKSEQVITPPTEPPGRAPSGQAFIK